MPPFYTNQGSVVSPMYYAIFQNKTETVKRLIFHGADIDDAIYQAQRYTIQERTDIKAWLANERLKKLRTRAHWAAVRAMYFVRPYALMWHTYVGQQLCAPGGKWAENDRITFEEEFNHILN